MTRITSEGGDGGSLVSAEGPVPKHAQVRAILLERIATDWQPHHAIPSERELVVEFGVSRQTVREAIRSLVEEQALYKVHGKGTFVAGARVQTSLHLASFSEDMRRRGLVPATIVRSVELADAPVEVRASLGLGETDRVWRIERLRLAGDSPMAWEIGYYNAQLTPNLGSLDLTRSLYTLLEQSGLTIDRAEQTVWAESATAQLAQILGIDDGDPLLVFRRTSSVGNLAVEHVTSWYRGDRYQVHMSLAGR